MRREKIDGKLAFSRNEWLNEGQVKSLFGKFAAKAKKGDGPVNPIDLESIPQEEIEEESNYQSALNFQNLTKDIIEEVESDIPDTQHPMWVKEINLCDLSKSLKSEESAVKVLKKVKVTEILEIIDHMDADELTDLDFTGRGKNQSLLLFGNFLKKFVQKECGCFL